MKRITLLLIAMIACLLTIVAAQNNADSIRVNVTETQIEYTDTPAMGSTLQKNKNDNSDKDVATFFDVFSPNLSMISVLALLCFGMPVIVIFLTFYFNNKKRKAKYRLIEKALAAGQPLPKEFLRSADISSGNALNKGITNIFTGIGLFIFLWAITRQFGIGTIGLLIMFKGFGQIVIHYSQKHKKANTDNPQENRDPSKEG